MNKPVPSRDELATLYFEQLPYEPYPVQEEALLAWFTAEQGVLVCAPTGTGKTLIAEAALFEALHTGKQAYYTTPLIALTEQKFDELQAAAVRWGFHPDDIGLVTGNRRQNPDARVLVVVAEILLNRLLHREAFDFSEVSAVVMDEFHNFNDPERGVVWELALTMMPREVRLLLLSATVGNAYEFTAWLRNVHQRKLELVQSSERKVPLHYEWVGDQMLDELLERMAVGDEAERRTPALVFCFNREECWNVAELLKGKALLVEGQQKKLAAELAYHDWSQGAGPKLKQILMRGVGVHHAGVMPKYRRIVEELFQRKLLSVCVCTETLAAGINLPARSVVLPTLLKGPPASKKLVEPSSAHQIFGRAGRPQFDKEGFVYSLAHEDDVRILRWKEKYDQIPENTKDPGLLKAKKALEKKKPTRRTTEQYWIESQFQRLREAPAAKLASRGPLPWRLLAYLLTLSPDVDRLRAFARKRLVEEKSHAAGDKQLDSMLLTLWAGEYVDLDPPPPVRTMAEARDAEQAAVQAKVEAERAARKNPFAVLLPEGVKLADAKAREALAAAPSSYEPHRATALPKLHDLLLLKTIHPLYGHFLLDHLGIANRAERLQAFESVLEIPGSVASMVRVPRPEFLPPGPLATERLNAELVTRGLVTAQQLGMKTSDEEEEEEEDEPRQRAIPLADKLRILFEAEFPDVRDLRITPVWAAGELLEFGGDFNKYATSRGLVKQEGIFFRHLLRLILLCDELSQLVPLDTTAEEWRGDLDEIGRILTESCRKVDPASTDKVLEQARAADVVAGEGTPTKARGRL